MYDDTQPTSTGMDQIAQAIEDKPTDSQTASVQSFGLGTNPSDVTLPTMAAPTSAPVTDTNGSQDEQKLIESVENISTPAVSTPSPAPVEVSGSDDLLEIKKDALSHLSPLVDKLDLTPEDRYKTLMMMIQSSDDQSLVKKAYEAAEAIEDETVRAQALLAIINEIDYFTQPKTN